MNVAPKSPMADFSAKNQVKRKVNFIYLDYHYFILFILTQLKFRLTPLKNSSAINPVINKLKYADFLFFICGISLVVEQDVANKPFEKVSKPEFANVGEPRFS